MGHLDCGCDRLPSLSDREVGQCLATAITGIEGLAHEVDLDDARSTNNLTRSLCVGLTAFDALGIGLAACNAAGHLLGCNRTAHTILKNQDGLRLNSAGILCTTEEESDQLAEALQLATRRSLPQEQRKDFALTVRRPSGKRPLTLFVRSLAKVSATANSAPSVAVVLIMDSSAPKNASVTGLRQLYGFTTREAHLANLLTQGMCLEACCVELGISRSTGSSHLKRLFKKTGVHHQSQLVSLLLRSIAMAGLGDEESLDTRDVNRTLFPQSRESFRVSSSRSGG
jgi:DNA-binding CsgD family transcriptional regulator